MSKALFSLFIAFLLLACGDPNSENAPANEEFILPDTINDDGLAFAQLGQEILGIDTSGLGISQIQDTITQEERWLRIQRTFDLEKGRVILEGEAIEAASATAETLNQSRIDRIRIMGPGYATPNGIRVGMPLKQLTEFYQADSLEVVAIPGYGRTQVSVRGGVPFFFLTTDLPTDNDQSTPYLSSMEALPPTATIESIVVM